MAGEMSAVAAPLVATSIEMANAARDSPNRSSGSAYRLTLNPATAPSPSEIAATAHAGDGASATSPVASATTAATRHTRNRAATTSLLRSATRSDVHPQR